MKLSLLFALTIGVALGLSIAYIDTRPHWDDAGISVAMILIASFVCGTLSNQKSWLIALSVGIWIPLFNIISTNNYSSFIALAPAFVGAYAGFFVRKVLTKS
jgi:hypothetical protein